MTAAPLVDPGPLVAGYLRVSTDEQDLGLSGQRRVISEWAREVGTQVRWFTDHGKSGALPIHKRPGLEAALAFCQRRNCRLVVYRYDRLTRDPGQMANIIDSGVLPIAVDGNVDWTTPEGEALGLMHSVFARMERKKIAVRVKLALAELRAQGRRWCGDPPYGVAWGPDGPVENKTELEAMARALELRRDGLSLRAIGRELAADGFTPRGKQWHPQTVKAMIRAAE